VVATFWVHQDPSKIRLGVNYVPLPDPIRTKLRRNTGVMASGVVRGTPAFNANILRDDVILKIGGEDVIDPQGFAAQLTRFAGQKVNIELLRGDSPKTITVTLNPGPQH
jgi:S1-C subfamily serine protease